jgi:hypothetical protein
MTKAQTAILEWLAKNRNVGTSSKVMAFWLGFNIRCADFSYPRDPADLNRCLNLLHLAPDLKADLPKMAEISAEWARLAAHWDALTVCFTREVGFLWEHYERSAPRTYALMQHIIYGEES